MRFVYDFLSVLQVNSMITAVVFREKLIMKLIAVILLFLPFNTNAKIYMQCELAKQLKIHGVETHLIPQCKFFELGKWNKSSIVRTCFISYVPRGCFESTWQ